MKKEFDSAKAGLGIMLVAASTALLTAILVEPGTQVGWAVVSGLVMVVGAILITSGGSP